MVPLASDCLTSADVVLGLMRLGCRESIPHGHVRPSHDLPSQRNTRDHPAAGYDGLRGMQDALSQLDMHSHRPSNTGDSSADGHFRIFPEAFGTDRGRVRIKVVLHQHGFCGH